MKRPPSRRAPVVAVIGARRTGRLDGARLACERILARHPALRDARLLQIAFLAALLSMGVFARDFALDPRQMALAFASGVITQRLWLRALGLQSRGVLSALITCFGLSILLRADSLWVHPLAAAIAISSKFALRVGDKHVFNPANLGVVVATVAMPGAWVSPGQWGHAIALAGWLVVLGSLVARRARRWDIAWAFLGAWLGANALRIAVLGQAWPVFVHQLDNGALLLFAFFMISDPMTIPNRRDARIAYALVVAAIALLWQYGLFQPNALVWALFVASPLVPLIDRVRPGAAFAWRK